MGWTAPEAPARKQLAAMTKIKKQYLHDATEALTVAGEQAKLAATSTKDAKETLRYAKESFEKAEALEKTAIAELKQARTRYDFAAADLLPTIPIAPNRCFEEFFATAHGGVIANMHRHF